MCNYLCKILDYRYDVHRSAGACWLVKRSEDGNQSSETIQVNKRMIEITKLNWRRNPTHKQTPEIFQSPNTSTQPKQNFDFEAKLEIKEDKSKNKKTSIWKEPSSKANENLSPNELSQKNKKSKARPKSYAEPTSLILEEAKRRSYQEATEGTVISS